MHNVRLEGSSQLLIVVIADAFERVILRLEDLVEEGAIGFPLREEQLMRVAAVLGATLCPRLWIWPLSGKVPAVIRTSWASVVRAF